MFSLTLKRLVGGCTPEPRLGSSFPAVSQAEAAPLSPRSRLDMRGARRMPGNRPSPVGSVSRSTRSPHPQCSAFMVGYFYTPPLSPSGGGKERRKVHGSSER